MENENETTDVEINIEQPAESITDELPIVETPATEAAEHRMLSELVATIGQLSAALTETRLELIRASNENLMTMQTMIDSQFNGIRAEVQELIKMEQDEKEPGESGKPRKRWL